ncbi:30S ribosomal protein S16 [Candidatus Curtissbacteria bacterium RIFCSPLOWO2_01_FULL_42_26]|uniref:Small ribosomal subunit protein bS16 n=1 Tax=Candidatus Curtissbacteria bacterium RIFCSPLOWO2_01_FULL_42_26 TaxID=1797729 RepID=A0A1F5HXV5_9BACT|nr:MAG: 30S ribosomal protein S16 [Candidatus Curtissbacteria bacterium RIFCSPLOWO2_01_FULL_42_26]
MSVRIRLAKTGKTHQVSYRIVAQDAKSKRDGRFLEILGYFQPYIKSPENLKMDRQKIDLWLSKGAKPTEAVFRLLQKKTG